MDHGSFSDAIAASGPLITNVTKAINGLRRLRGKYAAADGTAHAVVDELQLVKASLSNLRRWAQNNKQAAESCDEDFQNQFEIARDNVEEVLRDLQTEVDRLLEVDTDGGEDEGWDEESMKSHKSVLHDSMALLHTLVQASQWYGRFDALKMMRKC
ncbi:hypothetical protein P152DRAFT_215635 [Eremomyces bilateralis CBS 781.70]|uniref:Uncharacterized protein n=1 Tax=Eremomyces bilateralis CBS 781.70 TaxID=1392243 RepID=A0A6G1FSJ2_9PEZI|nr:uncharacterized protein P152DRAFT_215635 [Eremomyces bilateralis CBS 781.70]KAF1808651.1 hypothetical protein P152DRAFT_215635 [Eremomyces bilateralis CBS 781.70]